MRFGNVNRMIFFLSLILLIGTLFLALSTFSEQHKTNTASKELSAKFKPASGNGNVVTCIQTFITLKTWISNDAGFRILSFKEIRFLENIEANISLARLTKLFRHFHNIPVIRKQFWIANQGNEPPPVLS